MQQIQLNIISFSLSNTQLAFGFIKQKTEGYAALYKAEYPRELWQQHEDELKDISHLYCNFQDIENADYTATVDLTFSSNFANQYFRYPVYQFSCMYWKSINQQNLPVTTLYPEMVAEIYPHFKDPHLTDFGRNNLCFL